MTQFLRESDAEVVKHILVTGGAGYIGSILTGELLRLGYRVTVVDELMFGGQSLLAYLAHPNFHFVKADVSQPGALQAVLAGTPGWPRLDAVVHLAAIVGFPACKAAGKDKAWRYNVEATQRVFDLADSLGASRFIFSSTYSNYGVSLDGKPVAEDAPLNPQSLYAETKIAAEQFLLDQNDAICAPLVFRFATLYGASPRTRFDLIINQFTLDAYTKGELLIYQRGYSRSFVHIRDIVRGIILGLHIPEEKVRAQVYNLGSEQGNYTKDEIVALVVDNVPGTVVRYKELSFEGDMRDVAVSFAKVRRELGFETQFTPLDGVREVLHVLSTGLILDPLGQQHRNAQFIVN